MVVVMKSLNTVISRFTWLARRAWLRLDYLGLVVLALVLLTVGLQWQVVSPLSAQLLQLQQQLAEDQQQLTRLRQQAKQTTVNATTIASTQDRFLAFLPPISERNQQLQRLQQLIQKQSLISSRIDYQQTVLTTLPVHRLTIRFAVQGEDKQLAVFLNLLLRQLPNLAIDRLSLDKKDPVLNQSQLTLEASLFLRAEKV